MLAESTRPTYAVGIGEARDSVIGYEHGAGDDDVFARSIGNKGACSC